MIGLVFLRRVTPGHTAVQYVFVNRLFWGKDVWRILTYLIKDLPLVVNLSLWHSCQSFSFILSANQTEKLISLFSTQTLSILSLIQFFIFFTPLEFPTYKSPILKL